jgi:hypothetical protein
MQSEIQDIPEEVEVAHQVHKAEEELEVEQVEQELL